MVALGSLRERASRAEDGTVVNLQSWREAQHWYHEAAKLGHKDALEALGLLYQADDYRCRGHEAVELLIRASSDPQLSSTVPHGTTAHRNPLEQDLAVLLNSENAQCCEPRWDSIQQQELKEETCAATPCVAFCAHDNEVFCDGREAGNSRLSAYRSASVQTDATMLWTELPRPQVRRKAGRIRGSTRSHAEALEQRVIVTQLRSSGPTGHNSSDDEAGCSYTSAQNLVLKGDALYFGHGTKANPAAAVKLYIQGLFVTSCHYNRRNLANALPGQKCIAYCTQVPARCAAAQLYHAPAMVRLSECYNSGVGVVKEVEAGLRWLMEAAEANHPRALCTLAEHHFSGNARLGIAQDVNRAERLLRC